MMDSILSFLSNSIVIGVISSLIASIIIFFVSKFFFRRKINKEKSQRINMARKDVIYAIRPMVLEKKIIPNAQLGLFFSALAKQYEVDAKDIYDYQSLSEDLMKEILLNPLLSIENRVEYGNFIETFLQSGKDKKNVISDESSSPTNSSIYRLSVYVSLFTAILSLIATLLLDVGNEFNTESLNNIHLLAAFIVMIGVATLIFALKKVDITKVLSELIEDEDNEKK